MNEQTQNYWSIGEVLSLLQDEFPEVTISKIRFLESQGLIDPERTPSGYRRFYQSDFDRLQWILAQQRDHYLPLKVIRDRLDAGEWQRTPASGNSAADTEAALPTDGSPLPGDSPNAEPDGEQMALLAPVIDIRNGEPSTPASEPVGSPQPASVPVATETLVADAKTQSPAESPSEQATADVDQGLAMTLDEIAESSGCDVAMIRELERFGLVSGRTVGPTVLYDAEALTIARHAAQFRNFGLDPRHLRTFRVGAEREVALLAQVVEPLRHRRDPETRRKSAETMDDLLDLGASLRAILMRQITREQLPPA